MQQSQKGRNSKPIIKLKFKYILFDNKITLIKYQRKTFDITFLYIFVNVFNSLSITYSIIKTINENMNVGNTVLRICLFSFLLTD